MAISYPSTHPCHTIHGNLWQLLTLVDMKVCVCVRNLVDNISYLVMKYAPPIVAILTIRSLYLFMSGM